MDEFTSLGPPASAFSDGDGEKCEFVELCDDGVCEDDAVENDADAGKSGHG